MRAYQLLMLNLPLRLFIAELMMNQKEINEKIGEAWKAHYQGRDQDAITQFLQLTEQSPDNIDAHWGLALAYRDVGQTERAVSIFQKVQELVAVRLESEPEDYERYFMLTRMVKQQLERMGYATNQPAETSEE
jgi:thioredoxin-like negative regulator of GroEL